MPLVFCLIASLLAACGGAAPEAGSPVEAEPTAAQAANGEYISWHEHRIDDEGKSGGIELRGGEGVASADFDADGFPDFAAAFDQSGHLRIAYGSDDPDTWSRLGLAEGAEAGGMADLQAGDLNGDGRMDLIVACRDAHLLYLQNPASEHRGFRWGRIVPALTSGRGAWVRAAFADLNGDGRPEVIAAVQGEGGSLSWFDVSGDPLQQESWEEHVLLRIDRPSELQTGDLDGDGDLDLLATSELDSRLLWLENVTEEGGELVFEQRPIRLASGSPNVARAALHDLNGDGRLDAVVSVGDSDLAWLEQPASPESEWTLHPLGDVAPDHLAGFTLADIDQDGDLDLFAGTASQGPQDEDAQGEVSPNNPSGRVAWFQNPGQADGKWTRHDILRRERGRFAAWTATDLDGDGDLDFIGTRGGSGAFDGLMWFEQRRSSGPVRRLVGVREQDSQGLTAP